VAAQREVRPQRAVRAGNAFLVQAPGDRARADAGGEGAEDTPIEIGLVEPASLNAISIV
jgi:hypothetical protein